MFKYESKDSLKNAILKSYKEYISEFSDIPEKLKDKRCKDVECSPAENLALQVGWTTLQLKWEVDERNGLRVKHLQRNLSGINCRSCISVFMNLTRVCLCRN